MTTNFQTKTANYNVSDVDYLGVSVSYTVTSGVIKIESSAEKDMYIGIAIATTSVKSKQEQLTTGK